MPGVSDVSGPPWRESSSGCCASPGTRCSVSRRCSTAAPSTSHFCVADLHRNRTADWAVWSHR